MKRCFAIVLFITILAVLAELTSRVFFNGSDGVFLTGVVSFCSPLLDYPVVNGVLAVVLAGAYAVAAWRRPDVALLFGAAAWFAALIAVVSERGHFSPQDIAAIALFCVVSAAVLGHSAYTALRRQR
jgi:hypothetical protein